MLGVIARSFDVALVSRILFSCKSSCARAKLSSLRTCDSAGRASRRAAPGSAPRRQDRIRAQHLAAQGSRRCSLRLRTPIPSALRARGSSQTRSAPPSGSRSSVARVAVPKRPERRSLPASCVFSLSRPPTTRSRAGTKMSYTRARFTATDEGLDLLEIPEPRTAHRRKQRG